MKLMIGIPVLDNVSWSFFLHTSCLIGKLAKKHEIELCFVNRSAIDRAREITVQDALARDCDYILFIDDDTIIPFSTVELLLPLLKNNDKAICASGFCYQRGYSYFPMVYRYKDFEWGKGESSQLLEPFPKEPFRISATGMGVSLIKVKLLKEIDKDDAPCFGRDGAGTEDFYFFKKCWKKKFETWLNPNVEATHLGPPELINSETARYLRTRDHKAIFFPEEVDKRDRKGGMSL